MSTAVEDITRASGHQAAEIQRIFELHREHAKTLRHTTADERIAKLKRLKQAVLDHGADIKKACHEDFRKPESEVDLTEIMPVVMEANDAIRHVKKWMKPKKVRTTLAMLGTKAQLRYEPRGACLIISPWNYPINLTFQPLVSAIAAGNTAILKPSEMTPHCAQVIEDIAREVFEEDEVATFQGAVETSQNLLALPFDHIFFTGSPGVGRIVMGAAAKNLTSVTLELGGKSPVVVDKSANLKKTARSLAWGKFTNNGQTCIAPDMTYVHADIKDEFVKEMLAAIKKMYGKQDKLQSNDDYCRIVNSKHYGRIKSLLDDATEQGATVVSGGLHDDEQDFLAPTLLTDVQSGSKILEEEIFGPLMPIFTFTDVETVIDDINSRPKPLALYVYAKDNAAIEQVISNTSAGGTCINAAMLHFLHGNLPFGGVNNSGIGSSHGPWGFKSFSHERAVLNDKHSTSHLLAPPYNAMTKKLIKFSMKYFT